MIKYTLLLLLAGSVIITGCTTPASKNTNTNSDDDAMMEDDADVTKDDAMMEGDSTKEGDAMMENKKMSDVSFNDYENKAALYSVKIPSNWYWRHYTRAQIGNANPDVNDYLFISPTHSIISFLTEAPAEIVVEISDKKLSDFSDEGLEKSSVTISGQEATRLAGVVNNEVFQGYQQVEYRFSYNDKTYRILYLASADLSENVAIFEEIVKSFTLNN